MYHYSMIEWLVFFYFYSFVGWCFESTYVSLKSKRFVNRGFMRGPFLPLYGSGAIMMLVVSMPFKSNLFLVYIAGCVGATALEYVTGVCMEALFKVRYWDYSYKKIQFQGHICLSSTLAWGVLTIVMTEFVHNPVEAFVFKIPENLMQILFVIITVILVADYTMAFKAAMDLRDILIKLEQAEKELEHMKKRLDVMIAFAQDEQKQRREEYEKRHDDLMSDIEHRFEVLRERAKTMPHIYMDEVREEIEEMRFRFKLQKEKKLQLRHTIGDYKAALIRNNPGMASTKFKKAFEDIKEAALGKINDHIGTK